VTGGPMGVGDEREHPWLGDEKRYLETGLTSDKPVLAICLGAQLVAQLLGARITISPYAERGWWPITLTQAAASTALRAAPANDGVPFPR